jgi:hypothetical protein
VWTFFSYLLTSECRECFLRQRCEDQREHAKLWGGSRGRRDLEFIRNWPKGFVPMTEHVFQGAVQHMNADVKKSLDGVSVPAR